MDSISVHFCAICKTVLSNKSAYERHVTTNKQHLKKIGAMSPRHPCPDCPQIFRRADHLKRHQTNQGQCTGRQPLTEAASYSSRKHPLDTDPHDESRKRRKTGETDAPEPDVDPTSHTSPGEPGPVSRKQNTVADSVDLNVLSSSCMDQAEDANTQASFDLLGRDPQVASTTDPSIYDLGSQTVSTLGSTSTTASVVLQCTPTQTPALQNDTVSTTSVESESSRRDGRHKLPSLEPLWTGLRTRRTSEVDAHEPRTSPTSHDVISRHGGSTHSQHVPTHTPLFVSVVSCETKEEIQAHSLREVLESWHECPHEPSYHERDERNDPRNTLLDDPDINARVSIRHEFETDIKSIKALSDAMGSVSLKAERVSQSQTALSERTTLSGMTCEYGSVSLYQVWNCGDSQYTGSSGPEVPGPFNTTVDDELRYGRTKLDSIVEEPSLPAWKRRMNNRTITEEQQAVSTDVVDFPLRPNLANEEDLTEDWYLPDYSWSGLEDFSNKALNQSNASHGIPVRVPHPPSRLNNRAMDSLSDAMSLVSLKDSKRSTLSSFSSVYGSKSLFQLGDSGAYQSGRLSGPEMPGPFNTSIDSELREARRQRQTLAPRPKPPRALYWGDRLLEYAKAGDHHGISTVMGDSSYRDVDINYRSPSSGKTAFMIAVEHGKYELALGLIRWDFAVQRNSLVQQWSSLSTRDNDGKTVIDLMAGRKEMFLFTHFMERVLAIVCCSCSSQARRGSICEWIAHTKLTDRHGVTLQGPVKYPFRAGCEWGEKLRQSNWLQAGTLEEIDRWLELRHFLVHEYDTSVSVEIECRDTGRILHADEMYFRTLLDPTFRPSLVRFVGDA